MRGLGDHARLTRQPACGRRRLVVGVVRRATLVPPAYEQTASLSSSRTAISSIAGTPHERTGGSLLVGVTTGSPSGVSFQRSR